MTGNELAQNFFEVFLAGPFVIALYVVWKVYHKEWRMFIPASEMDITSGRRSIELGDDYVHVKKTWANLPMRIVHTLF